MDESKPILRVEFAHARRPQYRPFSCILCFDEDTISETLRRADGGYQERDLDYRPVTL